MNIIFTLVVSIAWFQIGMEEPDPQDSICNVTLVNALPGRTYREPIQVLAIPETPNELVIVERGGRVVRASMAVDGEDVVFLDLRGRLTTRNSEEGLLSLAFDPEWSTNKHIYTWRSMKGPRRGRLSRFTASDDGLRVDPDTEEVLLKNHPQPPLT